MSDEFSVPCYRCLHKVLLMNLTYTAYIAVNYCCAVLVIILKQVFFSAHVNYSQFLVPVFWISVSCCVIPAGSVMLNQE